MQQTPTSPAGLTALEKVIAFVDERVGLKTIQAKMLNEPIPGGSRWAYVLGSVLLFIFIMQAVTGILLMFYYVPTADHAFASTQYIIHEVDYGWFLLSYHFWGSTAMVVCVFAHMSQVFLWGAYKSPRELIWLVGLALFGIVMGFGFTGYLLPWDQRAYWATTVGVEIMDKTPVIGDFMARFLKGGATPGQMTLSRFFVVHVMILPAALMGLAGLHIFLFRAAGPAGPFRGTPEEIKAKTDYFFPRQIWKDIVGMIAVSLLLLAMLGMAVFASFASFWPYNLAPSLRHYTMGLVDAEVGTAFVNSLKIAAGTAVFGTALVFVGAYLLEKTRGPASPSP